MAAKVAKLVVTGLAFTVKADEKPEAGEALQPEVAFKEEIETVVDPALGREPPATTNVPVLAAIVIFVVVAARVLAPESV